MLTAAHRPRLGAMLRSRSAIEIGFALGEVIAQLRFLVEQGRASVSQKTGRLSSPAPDARSTWVISDVSCAGNMYRSGIKQAWNLPPTRLSPRPPIRLHQIQIPIHRHSHRQIPNRRTLTLSLEPTLIPSRCQCRPALCGPRGCFPALASAKRRLFAQLRSFRGCADASNARISLATRESTGWHLIN